MLLWLQHPTETRGVPAFPVCSPKFEPETETIAPGSQAQEEVSTSLLPGTMPCHRSAFQERPRIATLHSPIKTMPKQLCNINICLFHDALLKNHSLRQSITACWKCFRHDTCPDCRLLQTYWLFTQILNFWNSSNSLC